MVPGLCEESLKTHTTGEASRPKKMRRSIGALSFAAALIFTAWLPLGIFDVVPFLLHLPGESLVRAHAGAAVLSYMIAAWGFWEN